jgi:hypothetical protein
VLSFLRARGDDEPLGDVAQAHLLVAQLEGHRQQGFVGDARAADGLAALAGGLVSFQGAVGDALALHAEHAATPEERISPASFTAASSSGRLVARVEIFSEKTPGDPGFGEEVSPAARPGTAARSRRGRTRGGGVRPARCRCSRAGAARSEAVLDSGASSGEGTQNLLCAYLAAAVLVGLLANALFGLWWLDPAVGLLVAGLAVREGIESWRGEECDC